jgi:hypothetical protein
LENDSRFHLRPKKCTRFSKKYILQYRQAACEIEFFLALQKFISPPKKITTAPNPQVLIEAWKLNRFLYHASIIAI